MSTNERGRRARGRRDADDGLLAALLGGATYEDAAATAGVSRATVTRRMADAGFRARLAHLKADMLATITTRLVSAAADAVDVLRVVALDVDAPPAARVAAGRALLTLAPAWHEQSELSARLELLETGLAAREEVGPAR
jgi:hypothetical protein